MKIVVDGFDTFAATGGQDFDPSRKLAVLIHGAGMTSAAWALHSRWFAHHGWSVLAVDLPGHGRSAGTPLPSIAAMADWVVRLIDAVGAGKATLIGHSMGSLIALETAARHPTRIASLGLIGTAPAMPVHPDLLAAAKANSPEAIDMVAIWGHGTRATMGGSTAPGLWMLGAGKRILAEAAPGLLYNDLAACNAYQDGLASAAKIVCQATLVVGQYDVMTPLRAVKALAAIIPGARMTVLEDTGHMLMAERPDEVLDALIAGL